MQQKRKKIWIDRFQTTLSVRIALYFVLYQAAVWALVMIDYHMFHALAGVVGSGVAGSFFGLFAVLVVGIGLLFIYDTVCFTHRLVGPLFRFRKTIQAIAAGEPVELVRLRKGDFLQELK